MVAIASLLLIQLSASETIIDRAGKAAELFWQQFSAVRSRERVTQERLKDDGSVLGKRITDSDYVALFAGKAGSVSVEESRVSRSGGKSRETNEFLRTSGFAALLLLFHPDYRDRFEFEESPGSDVPPGLVRVAFRSRQNLRSMSALKLDGRLVPILWRGFAWIEISTGSITRIQAMLDAPMDDVGLSGLQADVEYQPVSLPRTGQTYRLPTRVTVALRSLKQQWRDVHEFSDYQLFSVTTSTRGEAVETQP